MKILYFDYWTKGLPHNILPLDRLLSASGFERVMSHVGSWRDPSVRDEEVIDGLLCREIRYYSGSLRKMFVTEKPDVVFVLNVGGTLDRLVNRICRNLSIKTVFLMHGVLPLGNNIDVEKQRLNKAFTIAKRISKAPKYLRIYRRYLSEIARTNPVELFAPGTYGHIFQMIVSPGSVYSDPWIDKDLYPDLALLYSEAYRKVFEERWKFPPGAIRVVGNPQLDPVFQLANAPDSRERISNLYSSLGIPLDKPLVVFLVDGLDSGRSTFNEDEWLEELQEVASAVRAFRGRLILKLHPTNNRRKVERAFRSVSDVHILQTETDLSVVLGATAAIGHISSALTIPIALNIPVLVPQWSNVYKKFDYYLSNGVAIPANTSKELEDILILITKGKRFTSPRHNDFVREYVGMRDGNTLNRIATEIYDLIAQ
jgi:hypothetical protein